jgi:hypothetical protein
MLRARDRSPVRSLSGHSAHALGASRNQVLARDLAGPAPTIDESWTGGAVLDLCANHPAVPSFAVLGGEGRDVGLIERERLCGSTFITAARSHRWSRARRWRSMERRRSKA